MTLSTEAIAYTSFGTVIGITLKWILDAISAERAHSLDLRRRLFDKQLDVTMAGLRDAKNSISLLIGACDVLRQLVQNPLTVNPKVLITMMDGIKGAGDRLKQTDIWASSMFGLFYGETFYESEKLSRESVGKLTVAFSEVQNIMDTLPEQLSQVTPGTDLAIQAVIEGLTKLDAAITKLNNVAQEMDTRLNTFTENIAHKLKLR